MNRVTCVLLALICAVVVMRQEAVPASQDEVRASRDDGAVGEDSAFGGKDSGSQGNGLRVMFWNIENFFDYWDGGCGASDTEFSSRGQRHWTKSRFYTKCDAVAKTILWVADEYGGLPDVVGFAEVENAFVVRSVLNSTVLRKCGYRMVHYDSPDSRGIDVALIYREEAFELVGSKPCHVYDEAGEVIHTRDILVVSLRPVGGRGDAGGGVRGDGVDAGGGARGDGLDARSDNGAGEVWHFVVNHHPSKFGGEAASRPRRAAAMGRLKEICDSLAADGRIVTMGDFNDTPDNELFSIFGESMVNLALDAFRRHEGTIRYNGKWDLIDMFIVSSPISERYRMQIVKVPFLMTRDNTHVGEKPLRTYVGPRYNGGVSDHCPILLLPTD